MGLKGKRVVVLGLGRFGGGLGAVRWLAREGADVVVTDLASAEVLGDSATAAAEAGAQLVLGGHDGVDVAGADLLVVNPAVPIDAPLVTAARDAGVAITTEVALLVERWAGPVLGVTGSNGKSTTVSLAHALLAGLGRDAALGGNLGGSLLDTLAPGAPVVRAADRESIDAEAPIAVLELSSFMLEHLDALGPDVAVITNVTPNHLDRHGTFEAYRDAKAGIAARARAAILFADDPVVAQIAAHSLPANCRVLRFGVSGRAVAESADIAVDPGGSLVDPAGNVLLADGDVPLFGTANRLDIAAAWLAVEALLGEGTRAQLVARAPAALASFRLPPHRMARVAEGRGVVWIDDSVSTTPESTAASLEAVGMASWLIVGGHDKGLDPAPLIAAARRHGVVGVVTIGEEGPALAVLARQAGLAVHEAGTVAAAVAHLAGRAGSGQAVLLSPGYSSHDQFRDFTERGRHFAALASQVAGTALGA